VAAWLEDAQTLNDLRDIDANLTRILRRTRDIDLFLDGMPLSSAAIVAPKGFGKTLLLKLKRIAVQESRYVCLPKQTILDRPKTQPPILGSELADQLASSRTWEALWRLAFAMAVLKAEGDPDIVGSALSDEVVPAPYGGRLRAIFASRLADSPFEILHELLFASRAEHFAFARAAAHLTAAVARVHRKVAIFVDNIDEYLDGYIERRHDDADAHSRALRIWHNGQIGAWLALRVLDGANPHLKIFVALRREAYHYARDHETQCANLRSFCHLLSYGRDDIEVIIRNNIRAEPKSNLAAPGEKDEIAEFVGPRRTALVNPANGAEEDVLSYWLRHATHRPRDSVAIGKEISRIGARERSREAVREAINAASAERVQTLFAQVGPFLEGFHPDLLVEVVPTNVLTRAEVEAATAAYATLLRERVDAAAVEPRPFAALYAMGLFGVVQDDLDRVGNLVQRFAEVGEVPFDADLRLPRAEIYLVHPALSDYIARRNVGYLAAVNRHNVVGDGLPFRPEEEIAFVLVGDLAGYRRQIMNHAGTAQTFGAFWEALVRTNGQHLALCEVKAGDAFLLADRSADLVLQAAFRIQHQLAASQYGLSVRIGGHSGHWRIRSAEAAAHGISELVGVAARLQALARPGDIVVTETFCTAARSAGSGLLAHRVDVGAED
jgi:class 3 adenylate cyclase